MTGAGSGAVAFTTESSFLTEVTDPTYRHPGHDPVVQDLELQRALERQRKPGQVFADESVAGNLEGAFAIEFTLDPDQQEHVHDIVFNSTAPYALVPGRASTSRWYTGVDYIGGTAERVLLGCAPLDYTVRYTQGGSIRVEVAFLYADEEFNATLSPSNIDEATGAPGRWHGMDLTLGGTLQSNENSVTLSLSNLSRFQRGSQKRPVEAVVGAAQADLSVDTTITEADQLELAYGGGGQTATSKTMDSVAGSLELSAAGSTVTTYTLDALTPDRYAWGDLLNDEADTAERIDFYVTGEPGVSAT